MANALALVLLDSRAPTGASNHSGGLEAAVTAGWVRDLDDVEAFCAAKLRTSGLVAADFAAAAHRLTQNPLGPAAERLAAHGAAQGPTPAEAWRELDEEFEARIASVALRAASRQLGHGLRRLLRAAGADQAGFAEVDAAWAQLPAPPHHPLVLGAGCALAGTTPRLAARAAALGAVATPAAAAVRLLGLDPYAVHAMLARLAPEIDEIAESAAANTGDERSAGCAVALELLADVHAREQVRLFAS